MGSELLNGIAMKLGSELLKYNSTDKLVSDKLKGGHKCCRW
jgi:hypothetical protein